MIWYFLLGWCVIAVIGGGLLAAAVHANKQRDAL